MMDEANNLVHLLFCLRHQTFKNFSLYICVNQPEEWHSSSDDYHQAVVDANAETMRRLSEINDLDIAVIDRSSPGSGWSGKKKGVGWARKVLFEAIVPKHNPQEIIVSLDADTHFEPDYFEKIVSVFEKDPDAAALSAIYYHPVQTQGFPQLEAFNRKSKTEFSTFNSRSLLRYECYMRHYLINLLAIGSPYAFSALGSAMAFTAEAYRRSGGITPLQGGEDFYLMQRFAKTGKVIVGRTNFQQIPLSEHGPVFNFPIVFPQSRESRRVPFGTGPAVSMPLEEQVRKYPFYSKEAFLQVKETYDLFPTLFEHDVEAPMSGFLRQQLATDNPWQPLRRNFKSRELFVRACKERIDGLRILQFLRTFPQHETPPVDFANDSIETLNTYRNTLFNQEMKLRSQHPTAGLTQ